MALKHASPMLSISPRGGEAMWKGWAHHPITGSNTSEILTCPDTQVNLLRKLVENSGARDQVNLFRKAIHGQETKTWIAV